jgi:outer membrane protein, adhesin transport system
MRLRHLFPSLLLLFFVTPSNGQTTTYGLKDAIAIGLERNFSILIARNNEQISRNNYTAGNAGLLPSLDLSGRHGGSLTNTTSNLREGGSTTSSGVFNTQNSASAALSMTIFQGFNAVTTYKRLGEINEIGQLSTQMTIENLVADIVTGYYNYILQVQLMNNMRYALSLSGERLRIDQDRYLLGSGSKLQVLQSQVYVNSDSSLLSRQTEILRAARIRLNEMMALEDLSTLFFSKDTSIDVNDQLLYEELLQETLTKNTSLQIASKNRILSDYDYKLALSRSYPFLNFSGGYNYNFNTFSNSPNKNIASNGMNYGLTLGFNIYDGFNQRRTIRNSEISRETTDLRLREIEQGIRADLLTIYNAYGNYLRLIALEEQNLGTAAENHSIAMERYRLGSLSGIELREVQLSLLDANERVISAHYQAKLAEASLNLISGNIMRYYQ